jgi:ATP-dependent DNA helicase RecG
MPIETLGISIEKYIELLGREEGHFLDFKSKNLAAARLIRSLSAFGNADGGELYLGIEDRT